VTDPRTPISLETPSGPFLDAANEAQPPTRIAFSPDLGITPVDPVVAKLCRDAVERLADAGVEVIEVHPDFTGVHETCQVLRAHGFASSLFDLYQDRRDQLKPEVVWNIERGLALSAREIAEAERVRGTIFNNASQFMRGVDLLITPATIVPPYPIEERYVRSCNGTEFDTYIDWLAIAYAITLTSLPALSMPAGLTPDGLPLGIQLVGKPRGEAQLLSHAAMIESVLGFASTPIDPTHRS